MAVTCGDPAGIGPEIVEKSLAKRGHGCPLLLVAPAGLFSRRHYGPVTDPAEIKRRGTYLFELAAGEPEVSFALVQQAADWALAGKVAGIVTGPVSKEKWLAAGIAHAGHTGFLAAHAGVPRHAMLFWSPDLKVALFSIHIPLRDVFALLDKKEIVTFIDFVDAELKRLFGRSFGFLFCGVNPHAGEAGRIGREETERIAPALDELAGRVRILGLHPPDVAFIRSLGIADTVTVCWYHDQGLIPFKLLHFRDGVNLTLGLPYVRTAPVHGTAFDIAGSGRADPSSMLAAIRLAETLVKSRP